MKGKANLKLSIVILNYNTKDLLAKCLDSLKIAQGEVPFEVIISDNGSSDGSIELIKEKYPWVNLIAGVENLGFARGNNRASKRVNGELVLFLNSDTVVERNTLKETIKFLENNKDVAAVTCKIELPSGKLDKDARRSFPTPWVALTHFSRLDRVFPRSRVFARYWYGYIDPDTTHEVDVIQGAFFLVRKKVLDEVDWFEEDYFLDGEDIDLCWKINNIGYKIIYYPKVKIIHVKGASKGKNSSLDKKPTLHDRLRFVMSGVDSMEIFYRKRLMRNYPLLINLAVFVGISIMKTIRLIKLIFT